MVASGTLSLQDDEAERSIQISHTIFSEFIHSTLENRIFHLCLQSLAFGQIAQHRDFLRVSIDFISSIDSSVITESTPFHSLFRNGTLGDGFRLFARIPVRISI